MSCVPPSADGLQFGLHMAGTLLAVLLQAARAREGLSVCGRAGAVCGDARKEACGKACTLSICLQGQKSDEAADLKPDATAPTANVDLNSSAAARNGDGVRLSVVKVRATTRGTPLWWPVCLS